MNLLEKFMQSCEFRITEGSEYMWHCYPDAHCLDSWNGEQDGHSFTVIFSTKDQTVYELQAHDYQRTRAYRWINPDYKAEHDKEVASRGVSRNQAWDDLEYVDLEVINDFFEKMSAIYSDQEYDARVSVPVDFTDEELLTYMKLAHERDITFNQLVEQALRSAIDEFKHDPKAAKLKWSNNA